MPFYRKAKTFIPLGTLAEQKAIKNGVHHAIFNSDKDRYVGDWKADLKSGKGWLLTNSGKLYEGDWLYGYRHGFGVFSIRNEDVTFNLTYRGDWVWGRRHGIGWQYYDNGDIYFGYWKSGKRDGYGKMWYKDGSYFVGYWVKDKRNGLGMLINVDGNRYEGHWKDDIRNGHGRFYHLKTGQLQEGYWVNDIAVKSKFEDIIYRQCAILATQYPIQPNELVDPDAILDLQNEESEFKIYLSDLNNNIIFCID